jgi:hypothetical protein
MVWLSCPSESAPASSPRKGWAMASDGVCVIFASGEIVGRTRQDVLKGPGQSAAGGKFKRAWAVSQSPRAAVGSFPSRQNGNNISKPSSTAHIIL